MNKTKAGAQTQNWKLDQTTGADMKPVYLVETANGDAVANTKDKGVAKLLMAAPALAAALKMFVAEYEGNGRDEREDRPEMKAARAALEALVK